MQEEEAVQLALTDLQDSDSATYKTTIGMSFFLSSRVFPNFNGDSDNLFPLKLFEFPDICCHKWSAQWGASNDSG